MRHYQKVLFIDASTGFYRMRQYSLDEYFGPIDLGLHLSGRLWCVNIGTGALAGSILPGSNRLFINGFSLCWRGFYISSMGGAGLVFDNLGINMISILNKACTPSILYLNRNHGEEVTVELIPVNVHEVWKNGRAGAYGLLDYALEQCAPRYQGSFQALSVGPAALACDFAGVVSAPVKDGKATEVDVWAGRGGFGTKLLADHGIAAIVYGGTDFEATTKYRFDPKFQTGGTFGANYATLGGRILAFNYRNIHWTEEERLALHERFILGHYLKQFNEEIIQPKKQHTCGEPCTAVCKKTYKEYKKDYEPYQTLGPLCGIFDQRAAEKLNRKSDASGFDAISAGGVLSWLMDCLDTGALTAEELGVTRTPHWDVQRFDVVKDSMHNADLGCELIDSILKKRGWVSTTCTMGQSFTPQQIGSDLRRAAQEGTNHGQRGDVPLPSGVGRKDDPGDFPGPLRERRGVPGSDIGGCQSHQLPQCQYLLGRTVPEGPA